MSALSEIPHFYPFSSTSPLTPQSAERITNTNERRFADALLTLQSATSIEWVTLAIFHEPGKVIPPPEIKGHCRSHTIPDFLIIAQFQTTVAQLQSEATIFYEIGSRPQTKTGKFKRAKAKQRRSLLSTDQFVGVIGDTQLSEIEKLLTENELAEVLALIFRYANVALPACNR